MKKARITLTLAVYLVSLFLCADFSLAYEMKDYFPTGEGNIWTYKEESDNNPREKVAKIGGNESVLGIVTVKLINSDSEYGCVAIDPEGIRKFKYSEEGSYEIYNPPRLLFPNISEGEQVSISTKISVYPANEDKEEYTELCTIKLEAVEDVKVPAGTFSGCLKFSSVSDMTQENGSQYFKNDTVTWLAPGVGVVKELNISTERNTEESKELTDVFLSELVSAIVEGKRIGSQ